MDPDHKCDWIEFKRILNHEVEKRATRQRYAVWVAIGVLAVISAAAAALSGAAILKTIKLTHTINQLERKIKMISVNQVHPGKKLYIYSRQ